MEGGVQRTISSKRNGQLTGGTEGRDGGENVLVALDQTPAFSPKSCDLMLFAVRIVDGRLTLSRINAFKRDVFCSSAIARIVPQCESVFEWPYRRQGLFRREQFLQLKLRSIVCSRVKRVMHTGSGRSSPPTG